VAIGFGAVLDKGRRIIAPQLGAATDHISSVRYHQNFSIILIGYLSIRPPTQRSTFRVFFCMFMAVSRAIFTAGEKEAMVVCISNGMRSL